MSSPRYTRLQVSSRREETPELTLLRVSGGQSEIYAAHRTPGQYAALHLPEAQNPGYMAIASSPGEPHFEFLVRGGGRFADALRGLRPGDTVEVSEPMGSGYPIGEAQGREVWLVATGSGLAALRPVVRKLLAANPAVGPLHLLVGARAQDAVPFAHELAEWHKLGVDVVLALSRVPEGGERGESLPFERGYVQDVLGRRAPDLGGAVVFVCGMASMVEAMRAIVARLSGGEPRFFTNY